MKYLFIDRKYVQRIDGVEQVFHQPVKEKRPVLAETVPNIFCSAPYWSEERSRWCYWYPAGGKPVYAESEDGLNWEKLSTPEIKVSGPDSERIGSSLVWTLMRDDRDPDPARRYKALTRVDRLIVPLVSPDGLNWTVVEGDRILSDDQFKLSYDGINNRYIATVKLNGMGGEGNFPVGELGRAVSLSVSEDFAHWTEPDLVFWADEIDQENGKRRMEEAIQNPDRRSPIIIKPDLFYSDIYNMPIFDYEDIFLGLPTMFNQAGRYWYTPKGKELNSGSNQDGFLYPVLVASRDLYNWHHLSREPFIPHSPLSYKERWDYGQIYASRPVRNGNELWFYYAASKYTHLPHEIIDRELRQSPDELLSGIYVARMRLDGFTSFYGGSKPGSVLTVPLTVTGSKLYVNTNAARGELRAEIRDATTGRVIQGYSLNEHLATRAVLNEDGSAFGHRLGTGFRFDDEPVHENQTVPITEDSTAVAVSWVSGGDLTPLIGRKVRLCFSLENAHLYSFWFGD